MPEHSLGEDSDMSPAVARIPNAYAWLNCVASEGSHSYLPRRLLRSGLSALSMKSSSTSGESDDVPARERPR